MTFKLYLDNDRTEPHGFLRVTTAENCIHALEKHPHEIDELSIDCDLDGEETELQGYVVAQWLEQKAQEGNWSFVPQILKCHSDNPIKRQKVVELFVRINEMWKEYESKLYQRR